MSMHTMPFNRSIQQSAYRFRTQREADALALRLGGYKSVPITLPNGKTGFKDVRDTRFIDDSIVAHERRVAEFLHVTVQTLHEKPALIRKNMRAIVNDCPFVDRKAARDVYERAMYLSQYERPESIGDNPFIGHTM